MGYLRVTIFAYMELIKRFILMGREIIGTCAQPN